VVASVGPRDRQDEAVGSKHNGARYPVLTQNNIRKRHRFITQNTHE
jgi:hypothetical protein